MNQVAEAVTHAATLLAQLKKNTRLDERDRNACERVQRMLEAAERVLYPQAEAEKVQP